MTGLARVQLPVRILPCANSLVLWRHPCGAALNTLVDSDLKIVWGPNSVSFESPAWRLGPRPGAGPALREKKPNWKSSGGKMECVDQLHSRWIGRYLRMITLYTTLYSMVILFSLAVLGRLIAC